MVRGPRPGPKPKRRSTLIELDFHITEDVGRRNTHRFALDPAACSMPPGVSPAAFLLSALAMPQGTSRLTQRFLKIGTFGFETRHHSLTPGGLRHLRTRPGVPESPPDILFDTAARQARLDGHPMPHTMFRLLRRDWYPETGTRPFRSPFEICTDPENGDMQNGLALSLGIATGLARTDHVFDTALPMQTLLRLGAACLAHLAPGSAFRRWSSAVRSGHMTILCGTLEQEGLLLWEHPFGIGRARIAAGAETLRARLDPALVEFGTRAARPLLGMATRLGPDRITATDTFLGSPQEVDTPNLSAHEQMMLYRDLAALPPLPSGLSERQAAAASRKDFP